MVKLSHDGKKDHIECNCKINKRSCQNPFYVDQQLYQDELSAPEGEGMSGTDRILKSQSSSSFRALSFPQKFIRTSQQQPLSLHQDQGLPSKCTIKKCREGF